MTTKLNFKDATRLGVLNTKEFVLSQRVIAGEECTLVFPKGNPVWTDENKVYRSSIWNKDGVLISAGFKKFTNFGEQPEFEPLDLAKELSFIKKVDGSCLIVSKYRGEVIIRTRNTSDARIHENGSEIEWLLNKYPEILRNLNEKCSYIFEWFSPNRIIIEKESQVSEIWLLGVIEHKDYSYWKQIEVDSLARILGVKRPERFHFHTFKEMVDVVKDWKQGEGVVVYGNNDQVLKKVKSLRYLMLHKMRYDFTPKVLESLYIENGMLDLVGFTGFLREKYDWEVFELIKEAIPEIVRSGEALKHQYKQLLLFAESINHLTRKEQASVILQKNKTMGAFVFNILDKGGLDNKQLERLWATCRSQIA